MMAEEKRYIDLGDKKKVVLTESDVQFIRNNPHGLTEEGAKVQYRDWTEKSKNRYMQAKYAAMLNRCDRYTKSGRLKDGRTIMSRNEEGDVKTAQWIDTDFNRYTRRDWEKLPDAKKYVA